MEHGPSCSYQAVKLVSIKSITVGSITMATASKPITLKITNAGKLAALNPDGDSTKILIDIDRLSIGYGKYAVTGKETKLKSVIKSIDTVSGDTDASTNTLQFSATIYADDVTPVYEMGIFTDKGVLFALAASTGVPLFTIYPNVAFVIAFGISLNETSDNDVIVTLGENGALSTAIMQNHIAAPNPHPQYLGNGHLDVSADPHPQYLSLSRFQLFVDTLFPIGYLHYTHSTANPKPEFDQILGINTAWRRLLGKIIVATDPADPYIQAAGVTLGQKGMTIPAGDDRPHTYPLYATNVFERYNPSDVVETVWQVTADKTSINEGEAVRFTVRANNLPDGQILNWTAKEGALNSASNNIATPEKSVNGTAILKNGSAIIDFLTTPDDNAQEPQKHVRLTIAAPANLSINVPIVDGGVNELVVHITKSTVNGIQLDEYYRQNSGSYPLSKDKIRFIVDADVDVIGLDSDTAAVIDGPNWPTGSQIILENRGRIIGRGGDAGLAATYYYKGSNGSISNLIHTPPTKGKNGGTAIKGNILVENYGFIAGGGGGGGGAGFFRHTYYGDGSSGGGGGGAPLGKRYPNPKSYEEYVDFFPAEKKYYPLPPLNHPNNSIVYSHYSELIINSGTTSTTSSYIRGDIVSGDRRSDILRISGYKHFEDNGASRFFIPNYLDSSNTRYRLWSWGGVSPSKWVDLGFKQSTDATINEKGEGGISLCGVSGGTGVISKYESLSFDITKNRGGDGGAIGENGQKPLLGVFYVSGTKDNLSPYLVEKKNVELIVEPEDGGLAGYVKEGGATIINYSSGTTKGR